MGVPVLMVGNFLSASGGSRGVCEELALRLANSGWPVLKTSEKPAKVPRLVDMVGTVLKRRRDFAVAQVDVYSGPAFIWAEAVCAALRFSNKPYVLSLHGGNLPFFARQQPERMRRLLRSASVVTTPSRFLHEEMSPYRSDLLMLPNALDLGLYNFQLRKKPKPQLVWLRAFHEIYNPVLAVEALALLAKEFPGIRMTMIGPDKADKSLQRTQLAAEERKMTHRLNLPGGVPKHLVPGWLEQGDIFLNTTNVDNMPVSVVEALACGLCVVSTNVGGLSYLLEHNHDALLVPPNNAEAMAAAVRRVLTERGLAERLSRNARATAERHDWSIILPQWKTLLESVATTGSRRNVARDTFHGLAETGEAKPGALVPQ